jgi:tRNA threonylcarbamoyl adenosine modification protein (Sua5/YciO/YrdC/YwlC family)
MAAKCRVLEIDPERINDRLISQAADVLQGGGIIAHPTDTTYALGVMMTNKKGVESLYRMKKKDLTRPLSFLCSDISNLSEYAIISDLAYRTMRMVLPGAYTFILPARKTAPRNLLWTNRKEIGLRVPDDAIVRAIVESIGEPLISTSAKVFEGELLASPYDIVDDFGHEIDLVIDAGYIEPEPSTIISFLEEPPEVWRPGKGSLEGIVETE